MGILSSSLTLALLGGVGALVSRSASHARGTSDKGRKGETKRDSFWLAATPYVLLTCLLLLSRLVPPLRAGLQTHAVLEVPAVHLSLPLLYLPGFWVWYQLSPKFFDKSGHSVLAALNQSSLPSVPATFQEATDSGHVRESMQVGTCPRWTSR